MTLLDETGSPLRCAPYRAAAGASVLGTAQRCSHLVFVEVPLPWPQEVGTTAPFNDPEVRAAALATRARMLALVPEDGPADPDWVTVVSHRQSDSGEAHRADAAMATAGTTGWAGFERHEYRTPAGRLTATLVAVLEGADPVASGDGTVRVEAGPDRSDLYLCTHDARDACCGEFGAALAATLAADPVGGLRVRRCSHIGGHRFAPTAISFPAGDSWAFLDRVAVETIAAGGLPADRLRGSHRWPAGPPQVAEAAVRFAGGGPAVAVTVTDSNDAGSITVDVATSTGRWRVAVEAAGTWPQPSCGSAPEPGGASETFWRIASVERNSPGPS